MSSLDELLELTRKDNWDGFGSRAVTGEVAANCKFLQKAFAILMKAPFEMEAMSNGTVNLSWQCPRAVLKIGRTRTSFYCVIDDETLFADTLLRIEKP